MRFDTPALKRAATAAVVTLPFAVGLGALAARWTPLVTLFFGSEWFVFKAVVGATEILVFGLVGAVSMRQRIDRSE